MKIGLAQLPVPDPSGAYWSANVPLAAGYLKQWVLQSGSVPDCDIVILDRDTADWGGDAAIGKWASSGHFDVIGFSLYLWNVERTRHIARRIKETDPSIILVAGGPETAPGSALLQDESFDAIVQGEGEAAFLELLCDIAAGNRPRRIYRADRPIDLLALGNPYARGILPFEKDAPVHLETVRGCRNRCAYCYYGKAYEEVRAFNPEEVGAAIRKANAFGVGEIYLMDPSFDPGSDSDDRLSVIRENNIRKIPIHSEIRLETVTPAVAERLRAAGFVSVEVGLQSVNARSLRAVNRAWKGERFIAGAKALTDAGIVIRTGIILGLPYETPETFRETLSFVRDLDLHKNAEVYPLALLPGTVIARDAEKYGISYMARPPYWVLRTPHMSESDFFNAIADTENEFGIEFFKPIVPHFTRRLGGFVSLIDLRAKTRTETRTETPPETRPGIREMENAMERPETLANSITVIVDAEGDAETEAAVLSFGAFLRRTAPATLVQLVFVSNDRAPRRDLCGRIADRFGMADTVFDRSHYYQADHQNRFSFRQFFMTPSPEAALTMETEAEPYIDLIVEYEAGMLERYPELFAGLPLLALKSEGIDTDERRKLLDAYAGYENLVINDQRYIE